MTVLRPLSRVACGWWIGAATILTAVLLVQAEGKALRPIGNDFTAYLEAAGAIAAGGNPYLVSPRFPYSYPLTLAWLLAPFRLLPLWLATAAWFGVGVVSFWRMLRCAAAAAAGRLASCEMLALALAVAIVLIQIVQNELLNGQVNLLVAALALSAAALSERRRPRPAAVAWGLAVALKLFPLILVPWFLLRRRWTELLIGSITAVVLCLFPVLWIGSDAVRWTLDYLHKIGGGEAGAAGVPDFIHLNLSAPIARAIGLADIPFWLTLASAAVLTAIAAAADWHRLRNQRPSADATLARGMAAAVTYLSLVVLVSPKSETHHMVFTLPGVILLARRADTMPRLVGLVCLLVVFNIGFVTPALRDPFVLTFALGTAAWCLHDLARA